MELIRNNTGINDAYEDVDLATEMAEMGNRTYRDIHFAGTVRVFVPWVGNQERFQERCEENDIIVANQVRAMILDKLNMDITDLYEDTATPWYRPIAIETRSGTECLYPPE